MKHLFTTCLVAATATLFSQTEFDKNIEVGQFAYLNSEILMPVSPLQTKVLFVGGVDMVQTTATYGQPAGETVAKEWHDFIGVTPDTDNLGEFWVSINHEMIQTNDQIGDGGGMTVFKASEDANGVVSLLNQTLEDGRTGQFFNVDFVNTVGETGMNCGGITSSVDGRIWTAEEWFRGSNVDLGGARDTADWTISTDIDGNFDGATVKKYQNFNYMVEIDPTQAKAIRKQYNWGRQGFEGGVVMADNKTVYLGVDATPAYFCKFVATNAGDFTSGDLFVYKHDATAKWVQIDNTDLDVMLDFNAQATLLGGTMYNRIEWVALDQTSQKVYLTETGRDNPGSSWADEAALGAVAAPHHVARAAAQGTTITDGAYWDYYGRVLAFDPATDEMTVHIEGGASDDAFDGKESVGLDFYPTKHLSNPDGLNTMMIGSQTYLLICEDLNGTSFNRMPFGISNRMCELFLLDLSIENPTVNDLIRITAVPQGAEITGATVTPSNKTILVNSQHPNSNEMVNLFPYNHSLTMAITGFEGVITALRKTNEAKALGLEVYPNPVSRELHVQKATDLALYNSVGNRVRVARDTDKMNIEGLASGQYILLTKEGLSSAIIIE